MTRYFYTDPLAAAWMAKHHGLQIVTCGGEPFGEMHLMHYWENESLWGKFYAHPDSLHQLEPRSGDIIQYVDGDCDTLGSIINHAVTNRIIQRDGKAFMYPEVEP